MKLLLINPMDPRPEAKGSFRTSRVPLGLMSLAGSTIAHGHETQILDAQAHGYPSQKVVAKALESGARVVGITSTTCSFNEAVRIADGIKEKDNGIIILLGGHHVTALPENSLTRSRADVAVCGEGEEILPQLLDRIQEARSFHDLPGLAYRQGDTIRRNGPALFVSDLDALPLPARELIDYSLYSDAPRGLSEPQDAVEGSRGCAYKCGFCVAGRRPLRFKSIQKVLNEISTIKNQYGVKHIIMQDDTFTLDKKRVIDFCKGIVDRNLDIQFACQTRFDKVDEEILGWLERAGCTAACFGVESGNKEVLTSIGKKLDLDEVLKKAPLLKNYSFKTRCTFILGWINESENQVLETIAFAKRLEADETAFCIATPFPGSRMWDYAVEQGRISPSIDYERFIFYHQVGCNLSQIPDERLLALQERAYNECKSKTYNETMTFASEL